MVEAYAAGEVEGREGSCVGSVKGNEKEDFDSKKINKSLTFIETAKDHKYKEDHGHKDHKKRMR